MTNEDNNAIHQIVRDAGWDSCDHFHDFVANDIRFTDRKYYDFLSSFDHWTHDLSGQNLDHKFWPQIVCLCERLHRYAASTIWTDPNPAIGPVKKPWPARTDSPCAAQGCARTPSRSCSAASTASPSRGASQQPPPPSPPVPSDHWALRARRPCFRIDGARRLHHRDDACRRLENCSHGRSLQRAQPPSRAPSPGTCKPGQRQLAPRRRSISRLRRRSRPAAPPEDVPADCPHSGNRHGALRSIMCPLPTLPPKISVSSNLAGCQRQRLLRRASSQAPDGLSGPVFSRRCVLILAGGGRIHAESAALRTLAAGPLSLVSCPQNTIT